MAVGDIIGEVPGVGEVTDFWKANKEQIDGSPDDGK